MLLLGTLLIAGLSATALADERPLSYMNKGDACRLVGGKTWTCQPVEDCPSGSVSFGGYSPCGEDPVIPLTCCPPPEPLPPPKSKASYFCEKYMEQECGGIVGTDWVEVVYDPFPVLPAAGGIMAMAKQLPHMALIGFGEEKSWACGGSLISDRYVLSAAHCASQYFLGPAKWVRLGEVDYDSLEDDARPEDFEIVERILHPNYREPTLYNDIALFKLDREVKFSPWIRPICLNTGPAVPFKKALAAGWGRTGPANGLSSTLMVIEIGLVQKSVCKDLVKSVNKIPQGVSDDSMLCAGDKLGIQDTCQGDSGGPLQVRYSNRCLPSLIGVTSFGKICTTPNSPGIYTKVHHFVPWIESVVWPNATAYY